MNKLLFFLSISLANFACAEDVRNAVVGIYSTKINGSISQGTGFFWR